MSQILNTENKKYLLYQMKLIRHVEEQIAEHYPEGKMRCPTHLSIGQEAVAAAVGFALRRDDFAISTHRAHAHYLGKGGCMKSMLAEIYGKKTGCSRGRGGSMHLIDLSVGFEGSTAIVANSIPIGVGLGLSINLNDTDQVSCIFLGDGAVEEGAFYEAANFAALKELPVLFICENNFYSVYSSLNVRQPHNRQISTLVSSIGLKSTQAYGNDVELVYKLTSEAITQLREKKGPQFLEFFTYRWREHCGPNYDNDIGYRGETEFLTWKDQDPIALYEKKLTEEKITTSDDIVILQQKINEEVQKAFAFAESSPFPEKSELFLNVYKS